MRIKFLSINRINGKEYKVIGKSKVKNNICDFSGIIEVEENLESSLENEDPNVGDGKIIGRYKFNESTEQSGTGVFEGTFEIYWAYGNDKQIIPTYYNIVFDGL